MSIKFFTKYFVKIYPSSISKLNDVKPKQKILNPEEESFFLSQKEKQDGSKVKQEENESK